MQTSNKYGLLHIIKRALRAFVSQKAWFYYIITASTLILFLLYAYAITPEKYNISVGQIASKTIVAPKNIVDTVSTEKERTEAAKNVEPVYTAVHDVDISVLSHLDQIFKEIKLVEQYKSNLAKEESQASDTSDTEEHIVYAKNILESVKLNDYQISTLLQLSKEDVETLYNNMYFAIGNAYKTSVREGRVQESVNNMMQLLAYKTDLTTLQNIVNPILNTIVEPNLIIDEAATKTARESAMAEIEDVIYQKGQNIVLEGNRIYQYQYQMLKDLGLVDDDVIDIKLYAVLFLFIMMAVAVLILILYILRPSVLKNRVNLSIVMLSVVLASIFCIIARFVNVYFAPILLATFLTACLVGARAATASTIITILLNTLLLYGAKEAYDNEIPHIIIGNIISGITVIFILNKSQKRQSMLTAGAISGLINFSVILMFAVYVGKNTGENVMNALSNLASAFVAMLLAMGLQPLMEYIFQIASENRLMELANPDQPLLKRLLLEAPGTYHHSMVVANLSEAAADVIGVNSLLCRIGSYYHDVGKLYKPQYFKENQAGENFHNDLDPYQSAEIVIGHVEKGLRLAKQHKLPREIREIIETHHGNSVVMYFYHEALQLTEDKQVDISKFRYPHPNVRTKEQSIVMMADTVEAAVRSMKERTHESIKALINKLIEAKMQDNQFSKSMLNMQEIYAVCDSFVSTLEGTYHERIEYPQIALNENHENNIAESI